MKVPLFALLCSLLGAACTPEFQRLHPKGTVRIEALEPERATQALEAIEAWKVRTNGAVDLTVLYGHGVEGDGIVEIQKARPKSLPDHEAYCFMHSDHEPVIWVRVDKPESIRSLVIHELGHAFGVKHIERPDSIMRSEKWLHPKEDIDEFTLEQFHAIWW